MNYLGKHDFSSDNFKDGKRFSDQMNSNYFDQILAMRN